MGSVFECTMFANFFGVYIIGGKERVEKGWEQKSWFFRCIVISYNILIHSKWKKGGEKTRNLSKYL